MNKLVLVDFDGVVINLMDSIAERLKKDGITFNIDKITSYNFDGDIGCDKSIVYKALSEVETFENAKPYDGAIEALKKLVDSGYIVLPYTSVYSEPIRKCRESLIKELGLPTEITINLVGSANMKNLKYLNDFDIESFKFPILGNKPVIRGVEALFEDCPKVMKDYTSLGIKKYFISHSYNESFNGFFNRCNSFAEAVDKFLE